MENLGIRKKLIENLSIENLPFSQVLRINPIDYVLTPYESEVFPSIMGNLTGVSISKVWPKHKLGRVYSFDILPAGEPDPIIIYCNQGDLRPYYKIWVDVVFHGIGILGFRHLKLKKYDDAIKHFLNTCDLSDEEMIFAVVEMLKFKNQEMLPGSTPLELLESFRY